MTNLPHPTRYFQHLCMHHKLKQLSGVVYFIAAYGVFNRYEICRACRVSCFDGGGDGWIRGLSLKLSPVIGSLVTGDVDDGSQHVTGDLEGK